MPSKRKPTPAGDATKPAAPKPTPAHKRAPARGPVELDALSKDARRLLLSGVHERLLYLSNPDSTRDGKNSQANAIALGILIDKCPDILRLVGADLTDPAEEDAVIRNALAAVAAKKLERDGGGKPG